MVSVQRSRAAHEHAHEETKTHTKTKREHDDEHEHEREHAQEHQNEDEHERWQTLRNSRLHTGIDTQPDKKLEEIDTSIGPSSGTRKRSHSSN